MLLFNREGLALEPGWLRNRQFDAIFIIGNTLLALISGAIVINYPKLFPLILMLDLWFLGYHHVVSTFTRLCFDKSSLKEYQFLVFYLPIIMLLAVIALIKFFGIWIIPSIYLYWQWYHYTRQSYGISQVYRKKVNPPINENKWISDIAFYSLPVWGILHRSHQAPETFLFTPVKVIPIPSIMVNIAAITAVTFISLWVLMRLNTWRKGKLPIGNTLFTLSHFVIFYVGYIYIEFITYGWLVLNIWHNSQYILFVWMYNNNRFKSGIDPKAYFLSTISQTAQAPYYFMICISISTLIYFSINAGIEELKVALLPISLIAFQTINFHHYVVDSLIWKIRKKPLQQVLEINDHHMNK